MEKLIASLEGAKKIQQARANSGRSVDASIWLEKANKVLNPNRKSNNYHEPGINEASWRRFLYRLAPIRADIFKAYCQVLNFSWEEIVEMHKNELLELQFNTNKRETKFDTITDLYSDETRWVGRLSLVATWVKRLNNDLRILSLIGITGIGKTALATRIKLELDSLNIFSASKIITFNSAQHCFDEVVRSVLGEQALKNEKLQDEEILVNTMIFNLQMQPKLLILDMVEELLELNNNYHQFKESIFSKFLDQFIQKDTMLSRIIIVSQDRPPAFAEGRYIDRTDIFQLKGLEEIEALDLFKAWDIIPKKEEERFYLRQIINFYEGHPLALRVIAGEIRDSPYQGDIESYWYNCINQLNQHQIRLENRSIDLVDLVKVRVENTLNRLREAHPLAHQLLCMGAIDSEAVEIHAWLVLIVDCCSLEEQELAFQILRRRCLLEEEKISRRVLYRLHSLIRSIALKHLDVLEDS